MAKISAIALPAETIRLIPLADLVISPINRRQSVPDADVEAMAEGLATTGLLQNLIGLRQADSTEIGIVGGGIRLRALQKLAAEGWKRHNMAPIDPVPCKLTDDAAVAIEWSGAENEQRRQLHPADEIGNYAAMRDQGATPDRIARAYGVTAAHVTRRLALANLPEPVLANLRAGKISLDVAKALTLAPNDKRAVEVLGDALQGDWQAWKVRQQFTSGQINTNDRRVKFVGLPEIEAAGIAITHDLFEEDSFISDMQAFEALLRRAGIEAADRLQRDGAWGSSEFFSANRYEYGPPRGMTDLRRVPGDLPDGDIERYDELAKLANGGVLDEKGQDELAALQIRLEGDYPDEDRATGHLVVMIDHHGEPFTMAFKQVYATVSGHDGDITQKAQPAKAPPQNLIDDLRKIKLAALQTALLDQPRLMLDLLAYQLTQPLKPWGMPLAISTNAPSLRLEKPEGLTIRSELDDKSSDMQPADLAGFEAFCALGEDQRMGALGHAIARLLISPQHELSIALAQKITAQTRSIWTPTATGYFKRLSGAAQDAIYCAMTPADKADHPAFVALKNADKAKTLEALFADMSVREALGLSREENARIDTWLPSELLWPEAAKSDAEGAA